MCHDVGGWEARCRCEEGDRLDETTPRYQEDPSPGGDCFAENARNDTMLLAAKT